MKKFQSDIDIDMGDRSLLLDLIPHAHAAIKTVSPIRRHNTGIYPTQVPYDPVTDMCSLDYSEAEERGYIKLDLLNVWVYKMVKDERHLIELMREPHWELLNNQEFVQKLIHLNNHGELIRKMPEPVNSIPRLAMLLAIIRPSKRHLIGKPWLEVAKTVWDKDGDGYVFKKPHAIAYANLVVINMNLLEENPQASVLPE
jgi:hypothetical protein